ncbi:MAG: hypothetical protein Q4A41_03985 [Bacillota bacterium]|nr:hypothetical protein [Bacillota bacterium]
MKTTILLAKIYWKELVGGFISKSSASEDKKRSGEIMKKLVFLLIPVLFYPQIFLISHFFYSQFIKMGIGSAAISVAFLISVLTGFFTVFSSVISNLGGDKVLTQLNTLPIKPKQIFSARMLLFYFITLVETVYLLSPTAILYAMDFGWHTFPLTLAVSAVIPIIPMSLALLVIMPFAKAFAKSSLKKFVPYVLNIGFFVAYLVLIGWTNNSAMVGSNIPEIFYDLVLRMYPPAAWGGGFVAGDMMQGLYFLLIHLLMLLVVYSLTGFFSAVVLDETNTAAEKKGKAVLQTRSVFGRLLARHWGVMFSSHRFVLQCLGSLLTVPILLVFYIYAKVFDFESMYMLIHRFDVGMVAIFISIFGPTITSSIGISSVAREGQMFWENKVIPISAKKQVASRFCFTMLLNIPVGLITAFIVMTVFEISVFHTVIGVAGGIGYVAFVNSLDHLVDIRFPNLEWTNEMQAVKNSKPIVISMLAKVLFAVLFGAAIFFTAKQIGVMPTVWIMLPLGIVLGIGGVVLLMTKGVKLYEKIDA